MYPAFVCFIFWFVSVCLETTIFALSNWFQPNLFFLCAVLFSLHWKGPEGYFISTFFGLTADCFSSLPFGVYGMTFFLLSFPIRWYAIKMYFEAYITLPFIVGAFTLVMNGLILAFLRTFFSFGEFTGWFNRVLINEVIPTSIMSVIALIGLIVLEKRYKIHLSERKF